MTHFNSTIYNDLVQNNFWELPVSPLCPIRDVTRRKSYFIYVFGQNYSPHILLANFFPSIRFLLASTHLNKFGSGIPGSPPCFNPAEKEQINLFFV